MTDHSDQAGPFRDDHPQQELHQLIARHGDLVQAWERTDDPMRRSDLAFELKQVSERITDLTRLPTEPQRFAPEQPSPTAEANRGNRPPPSYQTSTDNRTQNAPAAPPRSHEPPPGGQHSTARPADGPSAHETPETRPQVHPGSSTDTNPQTAANDDGWTYDNPAPHRDDRSAAEQVDHDAQSSPAHDEHGHGGNLQGRPAPDDGLGIDDDAIASALMEAGAPMDYRTPAEPENENTGAPARPSVIPIDRARRQADPNAGTHDPFATGTMEIPGHPEPPHQAPVNDWPIDDAASAEAAQPGGEPSPDQHRTDIDEPTYESHEQADSAPHERPLEPNSSGYEAVLDHQTDQRADLHSAGPEVTEEELTPDAFAQVEFTGIGEYHDVPTQDERYSANGHQIQAPIEHENGSYESDDLSAEAPLQPHVTGELSGESIEDRAAAWGGDTGDHVPVDESADDDAAPDHTVHDGVIHHQAGENAVYHSAPTEVGDRSFEDQPQEPVDDYEFEPDFEPNHQPEHDYEPAGNHEPEHDYELDEEIEIQPEIESGVDGQTEPAIEHGMDQGVDQPDHEFAPQAEVADHEMVEDQLEEADFADLAVYESPTQDIPAGGIPLTGHAALEFTPEGVTPTPVAGTTGSRGTGDLGGQPPVELAIPERAPGSGSPPPFEEQALGYGQYGRSAQEAQGRARPKATKPGGKQPYAVAKRRQAKADKPRSLASQYQSVRPSGPVLAVVGLSLAVLAALLWFGDTGQPTENPTEAVSPASPETETPTTAPEIDQVVANIRALLNGLGLSAVFVEHRAGTIHVGGPVPSQAEYDSVNEAIRSVAASYPVDTSALVLFPPTQDQAAPAPDPGRAEALESELNRILAVTPIIFASGQSALTELHQRILNNAVLVLLAYPGSQVTIAGYTDDLGDNAANQGLSLARAENVKSYLVSQGLPEESLQVAARGEETATGSGSLAGLERRVEFEVNGAGGAATPTETLKVAIVAPSASNDLAFTQSMVDAVNLLATESSIDLAITDNTFVPDEAAAAVRSFAEQGYDLVIAHGSQFGAALVDIAPQYPNTAFAWGTASDTFGLKNVYAYDAAAHEGGYVLGAVAARLSNNSTIGVVGPIEVGDAAQYVNGFRAGARAEIATSNVLVTYTGSFSDIGLASEAATAHLDAGADVMTGSAQQVVGAVAVADSRGALWFGTQANQASLAPSAVVASQVYHWEVALRPIIADISAGVLNGTTHTASLANGGLILEYNDGYPLAPEVRQRADQLVAGIVDGSIIPPR